MTDKIEPFKVSYEKLGNHVGSWIALVDGEEVTFGKLTKIEPVKFDKQEGIYATISSTEYEFDFGDRWATIFVANSSLSSFLDGMVTEILTKAKEG